jgi:pimeloyl-ACP methyl ester carboxylesterase
MATKHELTLPDGRQLVAYDSGTPAAATLTVLWHHGSPQSGVLLEPLLVGAAKRNIRLLSYARPSYGGSSPNPGRDIASAAGDISAVVDALDVGRFATVGASGGGPHALACGALLADRVIGVVTFASPAPKTDGFDWFAGMVSPGGPQAALDGRAARARYAVTEAFDENSFTAADWAALAGTWTSLGRDASQAGAAGPDGLIDDDVALVTPWGFEPADVAVPTLLVQGGEDRVIPPSHGDWLLRHVPAAELWQRPRDGHISVLNAYPVGLDWLLELPR